MTDRAPPRPRAFSAARKVSPGSSGAKLSTDMRSGRSTDRPRLEPLLAYARKGGTPTIVRLEERIDTGSAAGELVFHVFGAIAHFERRLTAERSRDAVAAARAEGRKPGRRPLDPEKLQAAVTLIRGGLPASKAARQVGLGRSTLYRELTLIPDARR